MKNNIREKRRLTFEYKRITPDTIRSFSDIIESEINTLYAKNKDSYYVMYSVDATDNTSFESRSKEIFSANQVIENRVVRKISMHFYTLDYSKNIEINIVHSVNNENAENYILVSGDYPNWVNGVLGRLSEIISLSEDQPKYTGKGFWIFLIWILFNVLFFRLTYTVLNKFSDESIFPLAYILGVPAVSGIVFIKLSNYINKVWPAVELQTGPNHAQKPKENRRKIGILFLAVVIPLLLALVYDVCASWF